MGKLTRRRLLLLSVGMLGASLTGCATLNEPPTPDAAMVAKIPTETPRVTRANAAATRTAVAAIEPTIPVATPAATASATKTAAISSTRLKKLTHGINAFYKSKQGSLKNEFESALTADDIKLIKTMNFTHIRYNIAQDRLLSQTDPEALNQPVLDDLNTTIGMILQQGLAVNITLEIQDGFDKKLAGDDTTVKNFARSWRALARQLAKHDPEQVFLSILGEPLVTDKESWSMIQAQVLGAMREGAPKHTLIAKGHYLASLNELLKVEPLADPNVVYAFHWYDPYVFTHQGADWDLELYKYLEHIPYPSSPEAVEKIADQITNPEAKSAVLQYGQAKWNADKTEASFKQASDWAKKYQVPIICDEFGAYKLKSLPSDRNAWLRDVRILLEKYGIGWSMWDYASGFGVVSTVQGKAQPENDTLKSLGLA